MVDSKEPECADPGVDANPTFAVGPPAPSLPYVLPAMMINIAEHLRRAVPEASGVSILLMDDRSTVPVAATSTWVATFDRLQLARNGPSTVAARSSTYIVVDDFATDPRWRDCAPSASAAGVRSMIAVPLVAGRVCIGILNAYGSMPAAFGAVAVGEARAFADYAATAVAAQELERVNERIARQAEEALLSRAIIEQAKGAVMAQRQCDPDAAFAVLIALSRTTNRRLRDVASQLVAELSWPPSASRSRPRDRSSAAIEPSARGSSGRAAPLPSPVNAPQKGQTP